MVVELAGALVHFNSDILQQKINNNSVLHENDIVFTKIYRLIEYMESNRADTVKEALIYDDQMREVERRKQAEQREYQAQEQFRKRQAELLEKYGFYDKR